MKDREYKIFLISLLWDIYSSDFFIDFIL